MSSFSVSVKSSAGVLMRPDWTSCSIHWLPMPCMSSPAEDTKWIIERSLTAGQEMLSHIQADCPCSRCTRSPQAGHLSGKDQGTAEGGRFSRQTRTISGITSPARCTTTVSPMRTSLAFTSSSLWSVALETVTPPTATGTSLATGVRTPVLPTCTSMACNTVMACSAGNLKATAKRGDLAVKPRACWAARSFTLATAPSICMA